MEPIEIAAYNPNWPAQFAEIAGRVRTAFADGPLIAVEHIGSTSVVGLAAKPIIDVDVIVTTRAAVSDAIARLAGLGYVHQGDLGIAGREAFESQPGTVPHHLYLCASDNAEYCRHITFRNRLRESREIAQQYEALKRRLAAQFPDDHAAYSRGKSDFVEAVLKNTNARQKSKRGEQYGRSRDRRI